MSLNLKKPYGEVCGGNFPYKFTQGDKFFDQHYNEVTDKGQPVPGGEYIAPELENAAESAIEMAEQDAPDDFTGMSVDGYAGEKKAPVIVAPEDDGLDDLKRPELFDQLDRLGVTGINKKTPKADLVAMLRDELKAKDVEGDE